MKYAVSAFLFVAFLFVGGSLVSAQNFQQAGSLSNLTINMDPKFPGPFTDVSVSIDSFTENINSATISFRINGVTKQREIGNKDFAFTTKASGDVQNLTITVTTRDGITLSETLTIAPASVSLLWEADTYTPPFYKGKALFTPQSNVKVVALPDLVTPDGRKLNPKELVYTWKQDGRSLPGSSGYGKQVAIIPSSLIPRPMTVSVSVDSPGGTLHGESSVRIPIAEPEIVFYENSPVLGVVLARSLGKFFSLEKEEMSLVAIPYFFKGSSRTDALLDYAWKLNGKNIAGERGDMLTVRQSEFPGTSRVSLTIKRIGEILQAGRASVTIETK
jgi:hypothetical protein